MEVVLTNFQRNSKIVNDALKELEALLEMLLSENPETDSRFTTIGLRAWINRRLDLTGSILEKMKEFVPDNGNGFFEITPQGKGFTKRKVN